MVFDFFAGKGCTAAAWRVMGRRRRSVQTLPVVARRFPVPEPKLPDRMWPVQMLNRQQGPAPRELDSEPAAPVLYRPAALAPQLRGRQEPWLHNPRRRSLYPLMVNRSYRKILPSCFSSLPYLLLPIPG